MNEQSLKNLRMTAAEVLAYAVYDLFPGVSLLGAEVSDIGFSYQFETEQPLTQEVMPLIEEKMRGIAKADTPIEVMEMMPANAVVFFRHHKLSMLADRLEQSQGNLVQILKIDSFYDLMDEPCGSTTKNAGVFKLLALDIFDDGTARISGTAFPEKQELKEFLKKLDRFKGLDFASLGPELQLVLDDIWLTKGVVLRNLLINLFNENLKKQGFEELFSTKKDPFYRLFKARAHLKQVLPIRYAQIPSAEIFCAESQLHKEIISSLQFFDKIVNIFAFRYHYVLCPTRAKGGLGLKHWGKSVDLLVQGLKASGFSYETDQQKECTVGPRVEICITDALGRRWLGPSLTIDLMHSERLGLTYNSADGVHKTTGALLWTLFESIEQLIKILVEQHAGDFPLWLAPEQVRIVPLAEANKAYATKVEQQLQSIGIRVQIDTKANALSERIHAAMNEKVPYTVIVGEKEEKSGTISVRKSGQKENQSSKIEDFLEQLRQELKA